MISKISDMCAYAMFHMCGLVHYLVTRSGMKVCVT